MTENPTIDLRATRRRRSRRLILRRILQIFIVVLFALVGTALFLVIDRNGFSLDLGFKQNAGARQISSYPSLSRVIDADTIVVGEIAVRLDGIAAPEQGHQAYTKGKWFVADLMREAVSVECDLEGRKSYDREVGACFFVMADGTRVDPQAEAVKAGVARDCPRYSGGRYAQAEAAAIASGQNLSLVYVLPPYCQ